MRTLSIENVIRLHALEISKTGGSEGIRDRGALESAVAQPMMTFGGQDLYPSLVDKAAALGHSLIANHPFVDGNKRIGHVAVEAMLRANGFRLVHDVDQAEAFILRTASGDCDREEFTRWVRAHSQPLDQ